MKRLIKKSEFFNAFNYGVKYYEIFKNPTSSEFNIIKKDYGESLRGIVTANGDLYIWSSEVLHDKAIGMGGIPDGVHLNLYDNNTIEIYLISGMTPESLRNTLLNARSNLSIVEANDDRRLLSVNTEYYGAKEYPIYEDLLTLGDIFNLNIDNQKVSKIKTAEFFNGYQIPKYNDIIEVFKNPSAGEIQEIKKEDSNGSVRGLLYKDGTIYAWPSENYHAQLKSLAGELDFTQYHFFTDGSNWIKFHTDRQGVIQYEDFKSALNTALPIFQNMVSSDAKVELSKLDISDAIYFKTNMTDIFNLQPDEKVAKKKLRLKKVADIYNAFNYNGEYIEIFKAPTLDDFTEIISNHGSIRGVITLSGDIYVWSGEVLHEQALSMGSIPDGIHFNYGRGFEIYLTPGLTPESVKNSFIAAKSRLDNLGLNEGTTINNFNTTTYGAQDFPVYHTMDHLSDIYNMDVNQE